MPTIPRPPDRAVRRLRRLRRRPAPFWLAATGLAALSAVTVGQLVGEAEAARARFGELRPTLVATRDIAAGEVLGPADAEVRDLPRALVPADALGTPASGERAAQPIYAGEAVLAGRLAPAGLSATASLLPPGTRGVAVPTGPGALVLEPGDVVDVLATFDPSGFAEHSDGAEGSGPEEATVEPTFAVAVDAVVVAVADDSVTVAVATSEAPRVAFALTAGVVTLALVGPG